MQKLRRVFEKGNTCVRENRTWLLSSYRVFPGATHKRSEHSIDFAYSCENRFYLTTFLCRTEIMERPPTTSREQRPTVNNQQRQPTTIEENSPNPFRSKKVWFSSQFAHAYISRYVRRFHWNHHRHHQILKTRRKEQLESVASYQRTVLESKQALEPDTVKTASLALAFPLVRIKPTTTHEMYFTYKKNDDGFYIFKKGTGHIRNRRHQILRIRRKEPLR